MQTGETKNSDAASGRRIRLLLLAAVCNLASTAGAAILNVPGDHATIQAAIDAAGAGDSIVVEPGTYFENLSLESSVNLNGRETARTILRAASNSEPIVTISDETNITFRSFTLSDSATGVDISDSSLVNIVNVVMERLDEAVTVDDNSSIVLRNNVFWNNTQAVDRDTDLAVISNNIFAANETTITSTGGNATDNDTNVSFNCFSENDDLDDNGNDDGLGNNFQLGDPLFVNPGGTDFHLREGSPCIDAGTGLDNIDASIADIGAYGGPVADPLPFPVPAPALSDTSATAPAATNIAVSWQANLAYLVTNTNNPGSYRLWYQLNSPGPPYNGTDAGGGTQPSPIDVGNVTQFTLADLTPSIGAPAAPQLLEARPGNEAITLVWTSVANATGFEIAYGVDSVDENTLAVGPVTEYTITGLINNTTYTFAVTARARATYYVAITVRDNTPNANESALSSESSIGIGETLFSPRSNELAGIPEQVVPYPDLSDDCFVATAAFGAGWTAEVAALRDFRDRFLLTNGAGRAFTAWYYRAGPAYAAYLREHEAWKPVARAGLLPLVVFALFMLGSDTALKLGTLGLFALLGCLLLRRRKRRPVTVK